MSRWDARRYVASRMRKTRERGMRKASGMQRTLRALGFICFSKSDLRLARQRFGLEGLVEVHHVIPRSCAQHAALRSLNFSVEDASNFVLMPTDRGARTLALRRDRLVHSRGHMAYNRYVWERLGSVRTSDELAGLMLHLHRGMRWVDPTIPWHASKG